MAVLEEARAQGKIRAYGISTGQLPILESMAEQRAVEVLQFPSSLLNEQPEFWRIAQDHNLGTQVRGVMAHGRLSGKYFNRQPRFRSDDNRSDACRDTDFSRYAVLSECLPEGITMAQAAIRWILDHAGCHTICMGAKNIDDYRTALTAAEMPPLDETVSGELERSAALLA
jgi:aryl-alcohol dehydrogenase-like predicted oxidoreductase